jgi:hypothetical protein
VLIAGAILTHEVPEWGEGDRICYAHWIRRASMVDLGIPLPGWSTSSAVWS